MLKMRNINVFFFGKCLSKGLMRKYLCIIMFRKLGICSNCVRQGTQTLLIVCLRGVLKASGASGPPDENLRCALSLGPWQLRGCTVLPGNSRTSYAGAV